MQVRGQNPSQGAETLGFGVHAMIFSEDAPALEYALHKAFDNRRLNRMNARREFFRVTLDEIETVVKKNFKKPVEFTQLADAEEYRQSEMMRGGGLPGSS